MAMRWELRPPQDDDMAALRQLMEDQHLRIRLLRPAEQAARGCRCWPPRGPILAVLDAPHEVEIGLHADVLAALY